MKKNIGYLPSMLLMAFIFINTSTYAQTDRNVDDLFDDKGKFAQQLWYGGGFTLGFSSNDFRSSFVVGLSPMVGYKVFENFSVGPRGSATLSVLRGTTSSGQVVRASPVSYSYGAFTRYKLFPAVFLQVEFEFEDAVFLQTDGFGFAVADNNGDLATVRQFQENFYVGGGYNSSIGGVWGYEIVVLYNFNVPDNSIQNPLDLRFGITYNF